MIKTDNGVDMAELKKRIRRVNREIRRLNQGIDRILSRGQHGKLSQHVDSASNNSVRSMWGKDSEGEEMHSLLGHGTLAKYEGRDGAYVDEKGDRPQVGENAAD